MTTAGRRLSTRTIVAGVGLVSQWKRSKGPAALGFVAAFASATLLLVALLRWDYEFILRAAFRVYPLLHRSS
jgi:hypothetical protein